MLSGLGGWLLIAAINNLTDPGTNRHLLAEMVSMRQLKAESSPLGKGLLWRAWRNEAFVKPLLHAIAIVQLFIACVLVGAAVLLLYAGIWSHANISVSINIVNYALCLFSLFWFFFLCGGLWFDYWIKFYRAQHIHFTLLGLGMLSAILINLPLH